MKYFLLLFWLLISSNVFSQREDKRLAALLRPYLEQHHGIAGIYVHHLKQNKVVAINADTVFPTASTIKVPIMIGIFDKIAKGELQYHQPLIYKDSLLYAGYGKNGLPQPNDSSFILLLDELRKLIPTKTISLYNIGPAAARSSWNGKKTGDFINYAWNPYYGSYAPPTFAGMTKSQLGPAAIWINHTSLSTAANLAQRTMNDGYGVVLYYDLPQADMKNYLSRTALITQKDSVKTTPGCLKAK